MSLTILLSESFSDPPRMCYNRFGSHDKLDDIPRTSLLISLIFSHLPRRSDGQLDVIVKLRLSVHDGPDKETVFDGSPRRWAGGYDPNEPLPPGFGP